MQSPHKLKRKPSEQFIEILAWLLAVAIAATLGTFFIASMWLSDVLNDLRQARAGKR